MSVVRGDPAKLWELYCAIGNVKLEVDTECQNTQRALEVLLERLDEKKKQIEGKLASLKAELAQVRSKKRQAEEMGGAVPKLDEMEDGLLAQIAVLEDQLQELRQCTKKAEGCRSQIEAEKKQSMSKLRRGGRKVNRYAQFLESLLFEEDYAAYQAAASEAIAGNHSGRFRKMEFRGVSFYCDDEAIDLSKSDGSGRTNAQRMAQGLAPLGADGLPMNLHHTLQSESGPIMELSETEHKVNHGALHTNTHDIPTGINRATFQVLKSAYWRRRGAFLSREAGAHQMDRGMAGGAPSGGAFTQQAQGTGSRAASSLMPTRSQPRDLWYTSYGFTDDGKGGRVYDSPEELDRYLYRRQGSANARFQGTCGLCSCANILRMAGVNASEADMIAYASVTRAGGLFSGMLCAVGYKDPGMNGGTSPKSRQQILAHFGVDSGLVPITFDLDGSVSDTTIRQIADSVASGHGVILSAHADVLWYDAAYGSDDYHAVTVTSVKKDMQGNILGFYICDSANGGTAFHSAEKIKRALTGAPMNVTYQILR